MILISQNFRQKWYRSPSRVRHRFKAAPNEIGFAEPSPVVTVAVAWVSLQRWNFRCEKNPWLSTMVIYDLWSLYVFVLKCYVCWFMYSDLSAFSFGTRKHVKWSMMMAIRKVTCFFSGRRSGEHFKDIHPTHSNSIQLQFFHCMQNHTDDVIVIFQDKVWHWSIIGKSPAHGCFSAI